MACSTCPPTTSKPVLPVPAPAAGNCATKVCQEILFTDCVRYSGMYLPSLDAEEGDNLTKILTTLDEKLRKGQLDLHLETSSSIRVAGKNELNDPLYLHAVVEPVTGNLLRSTKQGLSVVLGKEVIRTILTTIGQDEDLKELFCSVCPTEIVAPLPCESLRIALEAGAYALPVLGQFAQQVSFAPPQPVSAVVDGLPLQGWYRARYSGNDYINGPTTDKKASKLLFLGLTTNFIYQLKVQNPCSSELPGADSNVLETAFLLAPTPRLSSTATQVNVSLSHAGGDIDTYQVRLLSTSGTMISSTSLLPGSLTYAFANLSPSTTYQVQVIASAKGYSSAPVLTSISTKSLSTCSEITGVTAIMS